MPRIKFAVFNIELSEVDENLAVLATKIRNIILDEVDCEDVQVDLIDNSPIPNMDEDDE